MAERKKMVHAVFRDRYDAERAFDFLYARGYRDSDINVLMSDKTRSTYYTSTAMGKKAEETKHKAGTLATEGMGVGGAIGTAVGATLGAVAAIGTSLAIPGLGLVVAGPIAAALAGGGAGAVTGGLIGALVGSGMTEQNAQAYEEALRNGGVALAVAPRNDDDADAVEKKFKELNGENVCCC
jgi:hypothetical protein